MRVHASGLPFDDASGDRLRTWLGLDRATFYDTSQVAIVPMAFCFPGYNEAGSDLPPPAICRETWHDRVFASLPNLRFRVIVGGYAQRYHLGVRDGVTQTVARWEEWWPDAVPLPHPSWRNTGWLKRNPWFERDVVPAVRGRVKEILD